MATLLSRLLNGNIPEYSGAIIEPVANPRIAVEESCFDGNAETDWMWISSPHLLSNDYVKEWAANHSGLDGWYVVKPYPMLNGYERYEWRLSRKGEDV